MATDDETNMEDAEDLLKLSFECCHNGFEAVILHEDNRARNELGSEYSGSTVWAASLILAKHLEHHYMLEKKQPRPNVALELGAGTGLIGLLLCAFGVEHVLCTDQLSCLPLLRANCESPIALRRCLPLQETESLGKKTSRPMCDALDWQWSHEEVAGRVEEWRLQGAWPPDVVVFADCTYVATVWRLLLKMLQVLHDLLAADLHSSCSSQGCVPHQDGSDSVQQSSVQVIFGHQDRQGDEFDDFLVGLKQVGSGCDLEEVPTDHLDPGCNWYPQRTFRIFTGCIYVRA